MMAMEKKDKNLNVPNLRFPEFSGEWEKFRNCTLFKVISEKNKNYEFSTVLSASQTEGMVLRDSLGIDIKFEEDSIKTYKIVRNGDYVAHLRSFQGGFAFSDKTGVCSPAYTILRPSETISYGFLKPYFMSRKFIDSLRIVTYGIRDGKSISVEEWLRLYTCIPKKNEQQKISKLLRLIDNRIKTQKKIIEDLKKLKEAIAEKLFCAPEEESPELRIVNSSDRWISYRLKDVCQRVSERNSQGLSSLVLTIAAQYGLVSQTDFFNKSVASENLSNYYLIQKGDFAYNKSYSGEYVWGAVKRLELYEKGVLSPLYICFRPNPLIVNSDFLSHYFETHKWHNGIAQIAGEGARNHGLLNVSISDYFATLHRLPGLAEQKKIASYLNLLSDKISLANKELKCYSSQKQYLLARMFI